MEDLVALPWSRAPAVATSPHFAHKPPAAPSKEGIPENSTAPCCWGKAEEEGLAHKCHYFVFPSAKGATQGQVDITSGVIWEQDLVALAAQALLFPCPNATS